jgi:hypothetical protein
MKAENPEQFITVYNEAEHIKETNIAQLELVRRRYGLEAKVDIGKFDEWRKKYSVAFRRLLEREIRADSHFLAKLQDPATRDFVLEDLEKELYGQSEEEAIAESAEERLDKAA